MRGLHTNAHQRIDLCATIGVLNTSHPLSPKACPPGFGLRRNQCVDCRPLGLVSAGGRAPCAACRRNTVPNDAAAACVPGCPAGQGLVQPPRPPQAARVCVACRLLGLASPGGAGATCAPCGPDTLPNAGGTACAPGCAPGMGLDAASGKCAACAPLFMFSPGGLGARCAPCINSDSSSGSGDGAVAVITVPTVDGRACMPAPSCPPGVGLGPGGCSVSCAAAGLVSGGGRVFCSSCATPLVPNEAHTACVAPRESRPLRNCFPAPAFLPPCQHHTAWHTP